MTAQQAHAENVRVAEIQIENYLDDANYNEKQLISLLMTDGFTQEQAQEAYDNYFTLDLTGLCEEEETTAEEEGEDIFSGIDWDNI